MSDLSPGQEVTVSPSGITAEVLYVRGETVRVRNVNSGKARTVAIKNVTPKRESKVLTVGPVPKPVTLRSEPYLAYVRKHPCCLCGRSEGIEAHHWSHHGGVMGAKVDDYRTVPLCDPCHIGEWLPVGGRPRVRQTIPLRPTLSVEARDTARVAGAQQPPHQHRRPISRRRLDRLPRCPGGEGCRTLGHDLQHPRHVGPDDRCGHWAERVKLAILVTLLDRGGHGVSLQRERVGPRCPGLGSA